MFRRATGALKAARDRRTIVRRVRDRRQPASVDDGQRSDARSAECAAAELRASIVSVGIAVQREMDADTPDFDFLIAINENIAAGLSATG